MGKTRRDDTTGKAKKVARAQGQVKRNYGKAGAHADPPNRRRERDICREKVNPTDYEEEDDLGPMFPERTEEEDKNVDDFLGDCFEDFHDTDWDWHDEDLGWDWDGQ